MYINAAFFDDNQNFDRMEKIVLAFLWFITCRERKREWKKTLAVKYHNSCSLSILYNFTDKCGLALSSAVALCVQTDGLPQDTLVLKLDL